MTFSVEVCNRACVVLVGALLDRLDVWRCTAFPLVSPQRRTLKSLIPLIVHHNVPQITCPFFTTCIGYLAPASWPAGFGYGVAVLWTRYLTFRQSCLNFCHACVRDLSVAKVEVCQTGKAFQRLQSLVSHAGIGESQ